MRNYLLVFGILFMVSIFVTTENQKHPNNPVEPPANVGSAVPVSPAEAIKKAKDHAREAKWHSPSWNTFAIFFGFPNGLGAWVVLLTLIAIAQQTSETARAATATEKAVDAADKSFALQETTAKRQLRAYMSVKGARLVLYDDGRVEPRISIINSGQTPAYDLHGAQISDFCPYPLADPGRPTRELRMSVGIVGAGLPYDLFGQVIKSYAPNRGRVIEGLRLQHRVFFVKGYYTYRDIFKDVHFLEFQMIVGGPARAEIETDGTEEWLVFCNDKEGNSAD